MTITELAAAIKNMPTKSDDSAAAVVRAILGEISRGVIAGERVELRGFGVLTTGDRPAGVVRNVQTGGVVAFPARRTVKFKPSKTLKDAINAAPVPMREAAK